VAIINTCGFIQPARAESQKAIEKALGLEKAPFGINGLETAVPSLLDRLVRTGELSLERLIEALTIAPARRLKRENKGRITIGADADLTLLNIEGTTLFRREELQSLSNNTPFLNTNFRGAVVMTVVGGKIAYPFETDD